MEFLGKVTETTNDGRLIVECSNVPDIGQAVFDQKGNMIGTINRVFGPVDGPYASVESKAPDKNTSKGTDLYTRGGKTNGKDKGRSRRNRGMPRVRKPPPRT